MASRLLFYTFLCLLSVLSPTFQFFSLYRTFCCLEIQFLYSDVALFLIYLFRFSCSLLCHLFLSNSSLSFSLSLLGITRCCEKYRLLRQRISIQRFQKFDVLSCKFKRHVIAETVQSGFYRPEFSRNISLIAGT